MIKIGDKECRTMQEQVYKNMDDIDELKNIIKPMFKATTSLNSSSTTILISSTNAPDGTKSGWLIDAGGLLFKITGGDETSLLITYYSDLRGPQGQDGAAVNIDDSIESLTKVWSSKKTSDSIKGLISDNSRDNNDKTYSQNYIENIINNGIWYTTTQPAGSPATINEVEIVLPTRGDTYCENKLSMGDLFIYVDNDLKASELYQVNDITSGVVTCMKICDIGGGKQLYQHNLFVWFNKPNNNNDRFRITLQIINDSNISFDSSNGDINKLYNYLDNKGFTDNNHMLFCSGSIYSAHSSVNGTFNIYGVFKSGVNEITIRLGKGSSAAVDFVFAINATGDTGGIYDTIIQL